MGDLCVRWLGRVPYAEALALQEQTLAARRAGAVGDTLLLLEHPPVVTLGRRARPEHLLVGEAALRARGIEVHRVARGGDVTWHGPGQLVGYPVIDLAARGRRDVVAFLRSLEGVLCEALRGLGVAPRTLSGMTGVFADAPPRDAPRKLASIGVGVRGWVTYHGFAMNVNLDVADFDIMVPCGLHQVRMTTVADELGEAAPADLGARARRAVVRACQRAWA